MAQDWYLMEPSVLGGFENEEFKLWKGGFENSILNSVFARDVYVYGNYPTGKPKKQIRALVLDQVENSYNTMSKRQILCDIGELRCGDYLWIDGRWWICVTLFDNNRLYSKGILWYCNTMLHFTSLTTFQPTTYPVYVHNATQYNSGERYTDYLFTISSQRLLYVPCNEETVLFDNDYRFLIDRNRLHPSAWKVAQADTENDDWGGYGLQRLMLVEDELRPTDDVDNMLADNAEWIKKYGKNSGYQTPEAVPPSDGMGWIDF